MLYLAFLWAFVICWLHSNCLYFYQRQGWCYSCSPFFLLSSHLHSTDWCFYRDKPITSQRTICISLQRVDFVFPWWFLRFWSPLTTGNHRKSASCSAPHCFSLDMQFSEDCLGFTFPPQFIVPQANSSSAHQMQRCAPTPHFPNKSLWCQIDTLQNSSSWIWCCLAISGNSLVVSYPGWGAACRGDSLDVWDIDKQ